MLSRNTDFFFEEKGLILIPFEERSKLKSVKQIVLRLKLKLLYF